MYNTCTERLVLHDEPFQCYGPADKTMIDEFFNVSNLKNYVY